MSYEKFHELVESVADRFVAIDNIHIVSHFDADGLSAMALLIDFFSSCGVIYNATIVPQLTENYIRELAREDYPVIVFSDLGSGQMELINKHLIDKEVFVLDHHIPQGTPAKAVHLNPHIVGVDGSKEVSGAGVVYYLLRYIDPDMKRRAHIALIGAVGDSQEKKGFHGLNAEIADDSIAVGNLEINQSLRCFGIQTRPISKVLEQSSNPFIPNVSGNQVGTFSFLKQVGIQPDENNNWPFYFDLSEDDMERLTDGIIAMRKDYDEPSDIFGPVYTLLHQQKTIFKDLKEYATILNACGRLYKPTEAIGTLLGYPRMAERAIKLVQEYKKELMQGITWFYNEYANPTGRVIKDQEYVIINAQDTIKSTIIGTVTSMIIRSRKHQGIKVIIGLSHQPDGLTKVSARTIDKNIDVRTILADALHDFDKMEFGGHSTAAGALIPIPLEKDFINKLKKVLNLHLSNHA